MYRSLSHSERISFTWIRIQLFSHLDTGFFQLEFNGNIRNSSWSLVFATSNDPFWLLFPYSIYCCLNENASFWLRTLGQLNEIKREKRKKMNYSHWNHIVFSFFLFLASLWFFFYFFFIDDLVHSFCVQNRLGYNRAIENNERGEKKTKYTYCINFIYLFRVVFLPSPVSFSFKILLSKRWLFCSNCCSE